MLKEMWQDIEDGYKRERASRRLTEGDIIRNMYLPPKTTQRGGLYLQIQVEK